MEDRVLQGRACVEDDRNHCRAGQRTRGGGGVTAAPRSMPAVAGGYDGEYYYSMEG